MGVQEKLADLRALTVRNPAIRHSSDGDGLAIIGQLGSVTIGGGTLWGRGDAYYDEANQLILSDNGPFVLKAGVVSNRSYTKAPAQTQRRTCNPVAFDIANRRYVWIEDFSDNGAGASSLEVRLWAWANDRKGTLTETTYSVAHGVNNAAAFGLILSPAGDKAYVLYGVTTTLSWRRLSVPAMTLDATNTLALANTIASGQVGMVGTGVDGEAVLFYFSAGSTLCVVKITGLQAGGTPTVADQRTIGTTTAFNGAVDANTLYQKSDLSTVYWITGGRRAVYLHTGGAPALTYSETHALALASGDTTALNSGTICGPGTVGNLGTYAMDSTGVIYIVAPLGGLTTAQIAVIKYDVVNDTILRVKRYPLPSEAVGFLTTAVNISQGNIVNGQTNGYVHSMDATYIYVAFTLAANNHWLFRIKRF